MPVVFKEEPQTVPCLDEAMPDLPMGVHSERIEVKRARNRLAAQRCRGRKLERIAVLSDRVGVLKGQNAALAGVSVTLREELASLRRQLMHHVNIGCRVMVRGGDQNLTVVPHSNLVPCANEVQRIDRIGSDYTNAVNISLPGTLQLSSVEMSYACVTQSVDMSSFGIFVLPAVTAGSQSDLEGQALCATSTIASSLPIMTRQNIP